jgi:hypothetical protein
MDGKRRPIGDVENAGRRPGAPADGKGVGGAAGGALCARARFVLDGVRLVMPNEAQSGRKNAAKIPMDNSG